MSKTFEINGKKYTSIPFTFNILADMEEIGVDIESIVSRPISGIRAYFGIIVGDKEKAGEELEQHIIDFGDISGLVDAFNYEIEQSAFFKAVAKWNTPEPKKPQKKSTTKKDA